MDHHSSPRSRFLWTFALLVLMALPVAGQPWPEGTIEVPLDVLPGLEPGPRFQPSTNGPSFGHTFCTAGENDGFELPTEPAMPSEAMIDRCVQPPFDFDQASKNGKCFGHVFEGCVPAGCRIDRLRLHTRLRADGDFPKNDALYLVDAQTGEQFWGSRIHDLDPRWPSTETVTLSVAIPGPYPANGIGLLLQDDTRIDYAFLRVSYDCRARVCGRKLHDRHCDGRSGASDPALPGWPVVASGRNGSDTATTDADGRYCLYLPPGKYSVGELARPGWSQTRPGGSGRYEIEVTRGQVIDDLDFTNCRCEAKGGKKGRRGRRSGS